MSRSILRAVALSSLVSVTLGLVVAHGGEALGQGAPAPAAQGPQGRGGRGAPAGPPTAQASATNDLTGYWVRVVTEDWRWLMAVAPKGNADSIPVSPAGRAILDAWDPAKDEAEGNQCKGYGAGAISRLPTRAHVTWQDANTLKWETDQGMQTRLFKFNAAAQPADASLARTWQGNSNATWEPVAGGGRGGVGGGPGGFGGAGAGRGGAGGPAGPGGPGGPAPATDDVAATPPLPVVGLGRGSSNGWLKVVTTNVKSGYLRKNGLPYSEKATITEYFQPTPETYGVRYMVVTTIVEDPEYLAGTLITSSNYKKLPDTNNGWDPQPCSVR